MSNIMRKLRREGGERTLDTAEQRRVATNGRSIINLHRVIQHNLGHDVVQGADLAEFPMHAPELSDLQGQSTEQAPYTDMPPAEVERDEFSAQNIEYLNYLAGSALVNNPDNDIDLQNAA